MQVVGRQYSLGGGSYRYGFNGKENDNEVKGEGNQQDYGMRIYDPRVGRFLSVDPITKEYPDLTPYQFASNRPIDGIDRDGLEYAKYRLKVDYLTGKIMSNEIIWHNPNQHSEYGKWGKGILYEISVWDSWFKNFRSENVEKMVYRNGSTAGFKTEHGNYYGSASLYQLGKDGKFTKEYDYSLPAVDAVDNYAKQHDMGYDALRAVGANGLFSDWGTTPLDEEAMNGWNKILDKYKVGDIDPFNGQKITKGALSAAWSGAFSFGKIIDIKKVAISQWMSDNVKGALNDPGDERMRPSKKIIDSNYNLFLKKYMHKDDKGTWKRNENMWTKDSKDNWTPNKPK